MPVLTRSALRGYGLSSQHSPPPLYLGARRPSRTTAGPSRICRPVTCTHRAFPSDRAELPFACTGRATRLRAADARPRCAVRLTTNKAGAITTTDYIGAYEKDVLPSGVTEHKHMVGSIGVYVKPSNATGEMRYFLKDHLGSVQVVLSSSAVVLERLSYEPFGQRRNTNGSPNPGQTIVGVKTDRGYTGHEHLDESGLIHMNGRIFDPVMARFMSADPFVQAAGNLQSYNRYSYVMNNPLGYTDPSGFFFRQIREAIGNLLDRPSAHTWHAAIHSRPGLQLADGLARRYPQETQIVGTVVLGVVSWYCGGCLSTTAGAFWAAIGSAAGAAGTTYAQGGDPSDYWRAGLTSLGTSAAFSVVGNVTINQDPIVKIGAHALIGCASAAAGGGECAAGAAGAAAAKGITLGASELGIKSAEGQYVLAAVAGGTASQLAGGRFANGALTAAFGYLFNQAGQSGRDPLDRHNLEVDRLIGEDIAKGYTLVDISVRVEMDGQLRVYDYVIHDPIAGVNLAKEVKTTLFSTVFLSLRQVDFDVSLTMRGGAFSTSGIFIRGVGYEAVCFMCSRLNVRSTLRSNALESAGIPIVRSNRPGVYERR